MVTSTKAAAPRVVFEASEVADFCATDVATIYTWVKKGEIPYFKTPGGRLRFKREAVLDFLRRYHFPIPPELLQGRPRVLALDDDANALAQVKRSLSRAFDLTALRDPFDALLAIGHDKPDAVVMDLRFQGVDGVRVIERLRVWDEARHIRVVVFTERDDEQKRCMDAGAAAFVSKPSTEELIVRLRAVLGIR